MTYRAYIQMRSYVVHVFRFRWEIIRDKFKKRKLIENSPHSYRLSQSSTILSVHIFAIALMASIFAIFRLVSLNSGSRFTAEWNCLIVGSSVAKRSTSKSITSSDWTVSKTTRNPGVCKLAGSNSVPGETRTIVKSIVES